MNIEIKQILTCVLKITQLSKCFCQSNFNTSVNVKLLKHCRIEKLTLKKFYIMFSIGWGSESLTMNKDYGMYFFCTIE